MTARRASAAEVRPFARLAQAYATTGESMDWLLDVGECWVIEQDGAPVAGWAQEWQGSNLHVLLYGGRIVGMDASHVLDAILATQRPASASFQTRRRGLIRKGIARGYRIERHLPGGVLMKKDIP